MSHSIVLYIVMKDTQFKKFDNFSLELRRGVIVLAVLSRLGDPQYGYSLKKRLTKTGFAVDEGTLYPLLRRLESQGLLASRWLVKQSRPRRYYQISPLGKQLLDKLTSEWNQLTEVIERILQ